MTWEHRLLGFLDDLEQRAEGLALSSRDAEVEELGRAEYSAITLASRLHASTGQEVQLSVRGAGVVRGTLERVGAGWCLVAAHVVTTAAVAAARGLSPAAVASEARSP